jgi:hypothetical protein
LVPFSVVAHVNEAGEVSVNDPARVTEAVVPESTAVPALFVTISEAYLPATVVFVKPVIWIDMAVPLVTRVDAKVYVSDVPAKLTVPPVGTPVTAPSTGVPAVPPGAVIATDVRLEVVAVVNV